jgi:hypothetical protein
MFFDLVGDIEEIELIAAGKSIRDIKRLRKPFGPGRWRKLKGVGTVRLPDGRIRPAEITLVRGARHRESEAQDREIPGRLTMKTRKKNEIKFAVCINDSEPDLELRKTYKVLPDEAAAKDDHLRIIDESGEDYLYPASFFVFVEVLRTPSVNG